MTYDIDTVKLWLLIKISSFSRQNLNNNKKAEGLMVQVIAVESTCINHSVYKPSSHGTCSDLLSGWARENEMKLKLISRHLIQALSLHVNFVENANNNNNNNNNHTLVGDWR